MPQLPATLTQQQSPRSLVSWSQHEHVIECQSEDGARLRVYVMAADLLRFRYRHDAWFEEDFSYAPDPRFYSRCDEWSVSESGEGLLIATPLLRCHISAQDLRLRILDAEGRLINEDAGGFRWEKPAEGAPIYYMSKQAQAGEQFFGLGDKSCAFNLRGHRLQNWATDSFGYTHETDPLYRAIPFYYGLHEGQGYGIFFDNSFRSWFDFAAEAESELSFWAQGGEMNYYFFYGPELLRVAERYAQLTGRPELPPLWALGYHQCKWSYYPESQVRAVAEGFRSRQIPCDAIYLDIDYMDGYRVFTWNREHFPDPAALTRDLAEQGFRTVAMVDPGIKTDPAYHVFREGLERQVFLREAEGNYARAKVWPGECVFPDFTHPEVRTWWASLFHSFLAEDGISGVWTDMNEPAAFEVESKTLPEDVRFHYEGHPASHRKGHNVYGMQMSRATREAIEAHLPGKRPFVITRATYAGGQRFAAVWTGDNIASWDHLQLANLQVQRLAISGFSFAGSDIGGFNDMPSGELFVRWLETGIFHPLCRVHSIGYNDTGDNAVDEEAVLENMHSGKQRDQEPWSFGEPYTAAAREVIGLRYRLLPALYTAFRQYAEQGTPVLRPLAFAAQQDPIAAGIWESFFLGDHLFVSPVMEAGVKGKEVYLPQGLWYDFRSGKALRGGAAHWIAAGLGEIPMFLRAGALLPLFPVRQHTGAPLGEPPTLLLGLGSGSVESEWYDDAGEGLDYRAGAYCLRRFQVSQDERGWTIRQAISGSYQPSYDRLRWELRGLSGAAAAVAEDGKPVAARQQEGVLRFETGTGFAELRIG